MAEDRTQTEQKQRPAGLKTEKKQTGQNLREIRVGFVGNPNAEKQPCSMHLPEPI